MSDNQQLRNSLSLQPGIFLRPPHTYSMEFKLKRNVNKNDVAEVVKKFFARGISHSMVVGIGEPLIREVGIQMESLKPFTLLTSNDLIYPSTQAALWILLQGQMDQHVDPGVLVDLARNVTNEIQSVFEVLVEQPAYTYRESRDLAGFRDGTENPKDIAGAIESQSFREGTFALVQRWVHNLDALDGLSKDAIERIVGRRIPKSEVDSDSEIEDLAPDAHINRTKQEDVGFMFRRSQAFGSRNFNGLQFIAYASDIKIFERHLNRMIGLDGPPDALAQYSKPNTGAYYFCPGSKPNGDIDSSWLIS